MWELWGVEISAFSLTWHIAYTTANIMGENFAKSTRASKTGISIPCIVSEMCAYFVLAVL